MDTIPATWIFELVLLDVAVAGHSLWLLRAVAVLLLAVLPGQLLLRALRMPAASIAGTSRICRARRSRSSSPRHSSWILSGLHWCARAAASMPLLIGLNLALRGSHASARSDSLVRTEKLRPHRRARWLWPLLLPLASVVAAARLDNAREMRSPSWSSSPWPS